MSAVACMLCAARSTVKDWRWRNDSMVRPEPHNPEPRAITEEVGCHLLMLIEEDPSEYAYLRSRWTSEMLAKKIILIADNDIIHKSAMTQCFLKCNPKFKILFQPA